jgi:hypothetical protein
MPGPVTRNPLTGGGKKVTGSGLTNAHSSSLISRDGGEDTDDDMPRTLRRSLADGPSPRTYFRDVIQCGPN